MRSLTEPLRTTINNLKIADRLHDNKPINAGILFFNEKPDRFIDGARIELVEMPDSTGNGMMEMVFDGPLDMQIDRTVEYLRTSIIKTMVMKDPDTPVARRIESYPLDALEELISNAVYHKEYSINEPVTIVVRPDRISISAYPVPTAASRMRTSGSSGCPVPDTETHVSGTF